MRLAFFLLLFVNAAFLVWHQLQPAKEPTVVTAVKSSSGNKSIRLLHEVEDSSHNTAEAGPDGAAPPRAREPARPPADDAPRANSSAPRTEAKRGSDEPRAPAARVEPSPLSEIEKKVQLAEARQAERIEANLAARKNDELKARERPPATAEFETSACFTLGPFSVLSSAEATLANLTNLGLLAVLREHEVRSAQQWWVIDATKDETAAQKRLSELRKKKILDASLITSGEYTNMISLGKYNSESLANKRVSALVKLGFRPVVEKHFDSTLRYWVDVDETGRPKLTDEQLSDALGGVAGIEKQRRACK